MSRTRMFDDEEPSESPENPSPRTTIVGVQPEGDPQGMPPVPTGIQSLLRLAAVDATFRQQLLDRRDQVAGAAEVELTASERAILRAIPEDQLRQMAEQLPPPAPPRRAFLRQTAATAVVLLGGAAMASTIEACCGGISENPIERPGHNEMQGEGGAAPDWPPEETPVEDPAEPTPERPDHPEMQTTGGAAPDWPEEDATPEEERPTPDKRPTRGHTADVPPARQDNPQSTAKGGARPDLPDED